MRIAILGPFGLSPRMTMRARAFQIARQLASGGQTVTMLMPPWHTPQEAGREWIEDGVRIKYLSLSPRLPVLRDLAVVHRLYREALALSPDIVHVFKPIGHAGLASMLLQMRSGRGGRSPTLVTDQDDWEGRGGWSDAGDRTPLGRAIIARQERWALSRVPAITVSSRELQTLAWSLGAPRDAVHHIPNGPRRWPAGARTSLRERLHLGTEPVVLLYTRFFEFDVVRVAEEFGRVHARMPACRLLIVGQALRHEDGDLFRATVERLGLGSAVIDAGWVRENDLPDYFAVADVALYPFDDNLINRTKCPVKLTDLLYAGIPVVAESVGEIREYVRHRETGLIVPAGEPGQLSEATIELLQNRDLAAELARNASREMRTRYSWDARVDDLLQVYEGLLARRT